MTAEPWRHHTARAGDLRVHRVELGSGSPVLLLHGFPDLWRGWRRQMPALAAAGFRAIAIDLRGYGETERPRGVRAYAMDRLLGDVLGVLDGIGAERAHVAGHDWGGVIAWYLAMHHPERVDRLIVANAPHPAAFRRELPRGQLLRSWYALFFQLPGLSEWALRRRHFRVLERIYRESPERPGAFSEEDIRAYLAAAAGPGALTAMLSYYRAAVRTRAPALRVIQRPTLLLWGDRDRALSPRLTGGLERWVPRLTVEHLPEAGHWVLADEPGRVSQAMVEFLTRAH